jgi:hypothetical protein
MTHIVVRVPLADIEEQAANLIFGTALKQAFVSIKQGKKNIMMQEFACALACASIRILGNAKI